MMQKNWSILALTLVLALMVTFSISSCAKKKISSEPATTTAEEEARRQAEEEARQRELERQKALKEEELGEERLDEKMADQRTASARVVFENEDIYYEFDSIRLSPDAQEILTKKAKWLRAKFRLQSKKFENRCLLLSRFVRWAKYELSHKCCGLTNATICGLRPVSSISRARGVSLCGQSAAFNSTSAETMMVSADGEAANSRSPLNEKPAGSNRCLSRSRSSS